MLNIDTDSFTLSEFDHNIKRPKRNKAGGEDEIMSEMLQNLNEGAKLPLLNAMNEILESKKVTKEWKQLEYQTSKERRPLRL